MLTKFKLLLLLNCWIIGALCAQTVQFEGLKRTKPTYLLKFMQWDKRIPTDSAGIANGAQRIRNTRFFNEVKSRVDIADGDTSIVFSCEEIFTALPIFELGASEGNKWIRVGIEDENGLGRGIRTVAFYQHNDRHSFVLKQYFPLVLKQWGVSYVAKNWSIKEPIPIQNNLMAYNYINRDVEILAHYAFDIYRNNLELGAGYMHEIFDMSMDDSPVRMISKNFKRYLIKGNHHFNFLNHNTFYVDGWSNKIQVLGSYFLHDKSIFGSFLNEAMYFKKLPAKGNLALRGRLAICNDVNAYLAPFVLDNYYNIRGIGNRIERGTAFVTLNLEYRQTVWENKSFGFQMVGFTDAGSFRRSGEQLNKMTMPDNLKLFAGIGTRLIFKKAYDCDIRIDYGWGIHGERHGFVVGLGQYF
jgi:hypothetical protein